MYTASSGWMEGRMGWVDIAIVHMYMYAYTLQLQRSGDSDSDSDALDALNAALDAGGPLWLIGYRVNVVKAVSCERLFFCRLWHW